MQFGLIIIPILIVNLHAAVFPFYFILYLPYIAEYLFYIIGKKRKGIENPYKITITKNEAGKWLIIIMLICVLAGLLTPIGSEPYTHLYKLMTGDTTKSITEHSPLVLINNIKLLAAIVIFLGILLFTDTKIRLSDLFMLGGMIILTLYNHRQEAMFIIAGVFILNRLISDFSNKYGPDEFEKLEKHMTGFIGQVITVTIILLIAIPMYKSKLKSDYIDETKYPVKAADYILENLPIKDIKLYNEYNYGSYLLFRGIPVFIDSRADLYSPEFNKDVHVFNDFMSISSLNNSNIEGKLEEYGISHLILYKSAKLKVMIDQNKDKYKEIYSDKNFCIYERM